MNDAVDVLDHPIDERARRAAAGLRQQAQFRAIGEAPAPRSTAGRTAFATLALAAVLVAGLIVIADRQRGGDPAGPDDELHWVIDGLPEGWVPTEVRGPTHTTSSMNAANPIMTIFGSDAAPAGPVLRAAVSDTVLMQPAQGGGATDYSELTLDGVDLVTASRSDGARLAWAKIDDRWIPMESKGMDGDELTDAAAHLVVLADGSVQIPADHLPPGVIRLASGTIADVAPAWLAAAGGLGLSDGLSIRYSNGPAGGARITLTLTRSVDGQLAFTALSSTNGVELVDVDGLKVTLVLNQDGVPVQAAWQRDGHFFLLGTSQPGTHDLAALAAGVRLALPDEWAALSADSAGSVSSAAGQTDGTELAGTVLDDNIDEAPSATDVPSATDPPLVVTGEVRDITLQWAITDRRAHEITLGATLPDGVVSRVAVTIVGDSISVQDDDLGSMTLPWAPSEPTRLEWQGIGTLAFTHDREAQQLRVQRANGERYTVDLVTLTGEPDTKFAVLQVPEFVSSELLDADGNVLQRFERG